jgi:hypothetical protein
VITVGSGGGKVAGREIGDIDNAEAGKELAKTSVPPNREGGAGCIRFRREKPCIYHPEAEIFGPPYLFHGAHHFTGSGKPNKNR